MAAALAGGGDFATLAKERSKDAQSAAKGGELGWVVKEQIMPELGNAAFALEKDQISEPVQTQFGWHVLKVVDKRDAVPLEDVRDQVKEQVKQELVEKYVAELEQNANVVKPGEAAAGAEVTVPAPEAGAAPTPPPAPAGGQ